MNKRIVIAMIIMAVVQFCAAANYSTRKLQRIATAASLVVADGMGANASDDTTYFYKRRQLSVRTNALGDVSHIGYRMFNREIVRMQGNAPVFDFLERYMLELDLKFDGIQPAERMDIDGVRIVKGNLAMFSGINDSTGISVEYIPRRMYRLTFTVAGKPLMVTVPVDCQLLRGADAMELEDILARDIVRLSLDGEVSSPLSYWSRARCSESEGNRILDNGCYLSDMIGSKLYMRFRNGKWQLYNDDANPTRSVLNIMLTGMSEGELPLKLTIDKYGHKAEEVNTVLAKFLAFCRKEGCMVYGGIKTVGKDVITGTLFVPNEQYGYNHVLSFTFPLTILKGKKDSISARLYAYIPLQNVTEEFFRQNITKDNYDK